MAINKEKYIEKVLSLCEEGTILDSEYINAKALITLKCKNDHVRTTTTNKLVSRGTGRLCRDCNGYLGSGKKTELEIEKELYECGYLKLGPYLGALKPILVQSLKCNHVFSVICSEALRKRNIICQECEPNRRKLYTNETFKEELNKLNLEPLENYVSMKNNIDVLNTVCNHSYSINPGHLLYDKIGVTCKVCNSLGSIKSRFLTKLTESNIILVDNYNTVTTNTTIKNTCGHEYTVMPGNLVSNSTGLVCRTCFPEVKVSRAETEIYEYVKSIYSGWIIQSDRLFLEGKELDIVLPDIGLAIEYNGNRWHSEDMRPTNYHLNKTLAVEALEYQLIHITENEWTLKQNIVKSRLASIIGKTDKLYARKLICKQINFPAEFLNINHIQGSGSITKYNYGLFEKETLVAIMTFSAPRFSNAANYELVRYCSLLNTTIVGGASKLMAAFTKEHTGSILSYSDKRWSQGKMYSKLEFKLSHSSKPNYRYYKYKQSLSRYQCQKHLLPKLVPDFYSEELSESQIMVAAGYYKVFDCGNDVWIKQ